LERDELAIQDAAHVVTGELGDQRRHVPAAPAAHAEAVLRRHDRAEAAPFTSNA
jgi:hypothetical protein